MATIPCERGNYPARICALEALVRSLLSGEGGGSGSGTVTLVSVTTAHGVSGVVANPTSTPAISLTLGAITPASVAATGDVTGANLSGTNTGDHPAWVDAFDSVSINDDNQLEIVKDGLTYWVQMNLRGGSTADSTDTTTDDTTTTVDAS